VIKQKEIEDLVKLKGNTLFRREGQELEFKEQFSTSALADYFRDFAAFANNRGGYLILGIKDTPRIISGLSPKSIEQFETIDSEKITGYLLDIFSSDIEWEQQLINIDGKKLGVFRIKEAATKPVIAKKDEGRNQIIKNGEIYYRYGGRTQKIQSAELENIINKRIDQNNKQWLDLMSKIGRAGPENAAILDTEKALIEKNNNRILVVDENLANKIKFIKEGQFDEKTGKTTLKLVGDIRPVGSVEVVKKVKENLTKAYPYSAKELVKKVQNKEPSSKQGDIWKIISENDMKKNLDYSAFVFRNKSQEDQYLNKGILSKNVPSIYNDKAVNFILKILERNQ